MRAASSLALLALTTGSTNAIFCFVKERKCLPGVELSVDYDEIGTLLGITKSSTATGTATQTASVSSTTPPATSIPTVDSATFAVPTSVSRDFLNDIFPPRINATQATQATPAAPLVAATSATPGMPGFLGDLFPRGHEEVPQAYVKPSYAVQPPSASTESPRTPPSYHAPDLLPFPSADLEFPRFNLTTSKASPAPPAYTAEFLQPHSVSSHVMEIPTPYATHASKVFSVVSSESESVAQSSATTHLAEHFTAPVYHNSVPSAPVKSEASNHSNSLVPSKYVAEDVVDVTTTVTEWITITPTRTVAQPETTAFHKESHAALQPKPSAPEKEAYTSEHPKPSASQQKEVPEVFSLTKTVDVWLPPTWMSFATAAPYTSKEKHSEVPTSMYSPESAKTGVYPVPSNATAIHSTNYVAKATGTKAVRPTVYVTPVPAAQSSWAWTQNPDGKPEQYTGAANTNSRDVLFVAVAGMVALMII